MDIFQDDNDEKEDKNQDNGKDDPSNEDQNQDQEDKRDDNNDQQTQASLDADYNVDEYNLDEQLPDNDTNEQNSEQIIQKKVNPNDLDYKIFTSQFDQVIKAEKLENADDASKLRKTLDQQLIGFQDLITKLANKLQRQLLAKQNDRGNLI